MTFYIFLMAVLLLIAIITRVSGNPVQIFKIDRNFASLQPNQDALAIYKLSLNLIRRFFVLETDRG